MALTSGIKLGPYEILSPLGTGGMRSFASDNSACKWVIRVQRQRSRE